jgi:pimeloyl-ACP methyl ester carboxylesterase
VQEALAETTFVRERILSLPDRFRPEAADGVAARVELSIDDENYQLVFGRGQCAVAEGAAVRAETTIRTDAATWLALDDGREESIDAFLSGRLSVRGNVDLASRLQSLFVPSGRARTHADLEQATIKADGLNLSSYVFGDGPPVVFLHGLAGSKLSWLPILPAFARSFRLIVPDLPGHGESSKPRRSYTMRFYAGVVEELMRNLDVREAILVGNSMGGRISLEVAARNPKRVRGMALLDPAVPDLFVGWVLQFARMVPNELGLIPLPFRRRLVRTAIAGLFAGPERLPEAGFEAGVDEFIRIHRSARARMAVWSSLRMLISEDRDRFWRAVRRIRAPALILCGTEDRLVPIRLVERLAAELPAAEFHALPSVGHVPQFEVPEITTDLLQTFLNGLTT